MAVGRGARMWRFDAGRICLDLVATERAGGVPGTCEQLDGPDHLTQWLTDAGLVPAGHRAGRAGRHLGGPLPRTALRSLPVDDRPARRAPGRRCAGAGQLPGLRRASGPRAVRGADGVLVRALSATPDCAGLLAVVARDAVDLLTDPVARAALRRCQGEACHRLYLDTSRGGRRRWCSGEVCGNRERGSPGTGAGPRDRPVRPARRLPARTAPVNPARTARGKKFRPALNEPAPTPVSMVQEPFQRSRPGGSGAQGCGRGR